MDEALGPTHAGEARDPSGTLCVQRRKGLPAAIAQHTDKVHHAPRPVYRRQNGRIVANVHLNRDNLADIAQRLQKTRRFRPPDPDPDAMPLRSQASHQVPPDEPLTANDGNQSVAHPILRFMNAAILTAHGKRSMSVQRA